MKKYRKSFLWLFIAYCITMLALLFIRDMKNEYPYWIQVSKRFNLMPFKNIGRYIARFDGSKGFKAWIDAIVNVFGNIIMFIPFGWFVPFLFERFRSYFKTIGLSLLIILAVETTQLFTLRGFFDIDDIILNILGISTGYYLFYRGNK